VKKEKLRACDVLNFDYLAKIADKSEEDAEVLDEGLATFAYNFTSTADEGNRDTLLANLMSNATAHQSKDTAEKIVELLARRLQTDHQKLREFGKENGVRLKRGSG
jgi:hypothetical protein